MTVTKLPIYNLYNMPEALRKLADEIEAGTFKTERIIVCMELDGGGVAYTAFGRDFYWMRGVGLTEAVKQKILKEKGGI